MNAAKAAVVCLALAGIALAGPSFRIGTKLTWRNGTVSSGWFGTPENPLFQINFMEPSVGPTIEAVYGPAWNVLSGRIDLVQASAFTAGGVAFRFFPMLGLDMLVEPPVNWRVKPYVWAGVRTTAYAWMPKTDYEVFRPESETHWRGGLGAKYRLSRRVDLFAEMQWYAFDQWWMGFTEFEDGTVIGAGTQYEGVGLAGAELGVRFALGK